LTSTTPKKRGLVWRGIEVGGRISLSKIERNLEGMVRKALEKNPPRNY
jgi:hypothetical protein